MFVNLKLVIGYYLVIGAWNLIIVELFNEIWVASP
jgi:hypothetical protein